MKRNFKTTIGMLFVSAAIAACGGSDGTSGGIDTKESGSGAVTGFGSVIIEGVRYDDTSAVVSNEIDATMPVTAGLTDIKLGMQVDVQADGENAESFTIRSEVRAEVESISSTGLVLAGQTVVVSDETVFEGAESLADLAAGDYLEVHGQRDDAGVINASRIERLDPDLTRIWRVAGLASQVDAAAQTFMIGNLLIQWSDTTRIAPSVAAIVDGARVAVYGNTAPVAGTLAARAIRVRGDADVDVRIRVGGRIRGLDFAAQTFHIRRFGIDASEARYANGSAGDLANGRYVRVVGNVQADDSGKRFVKASTVTFRRDFDDHTQVTGPISGYVSAGSFMVRGVPVDASADSVRFVDGDATNLANGVIVKVTGNVDGNVLIASGVEFVSTDLSDRRSVAGLVRNLDKQAGTLTVFGVALQLQPETIYEFGDGSAASIDDLNDGDLVRAIGAADAGIFQVAKLVIRRGPSVVIDEIDGSIYKVDIASGRFHLNGTVVRLDDGISFDAVRENLRNGVRVEVSGEYVNGELVAREITVIRPE